MHKYAGVIASMALAAHSLLIPDSLGDDNAMETLAINPFKRTVALECPGCASAHAENNILSWNEGEGSSFVSLPLNSGRLTG
jgi:hypothetical protein